MKKSMFLIPLLAMLLALVVPVRAAQEQHPHTSAGHCVCGGAAEGVGDHVCQELTVWTPISGEVNFGSLASGNYYLTGDVTVGTAGTIGQITQYTNYAVLKEARHVVLCLNGYDIITTQSRVFANVVMDSSLSVCDCSWDGSSFGGTVTGGSSKYGGITYLYAKSTLNIYGGNWTRQAGMTNDQGGLFVVAQDYGTNTSCKTDPNQKSVLNLYNGNIYDGSSRIGGNINVMHYSQFNMYGGSVTGGNATERGGNLYFNATASVNLYGGTVSGGSPETVMAVKQNGALAGSYSTVSQAAAQGDYVRLLTDLATTDTVSGDLYIDLAGHHLSGLTVTGTVYGMDSTTDAYDGSQAGSLSCTGDVELHHKTAITGSIKRYLTVEENGAYSFHRFYLGITALSMKPDSAGVGYKATVAGDDAVKANLTAYGYRLWVENGEPVTCTKDADQLEGMQTVTLRVDHFLRQNSSLRSNRQRSELPLSAVVLFQLKDGTELQSSVATYSFREMTEAANEVYEGYTLAQKTALQELSALYTQVMISWDIHRFHHPAGSWTAMNQTGFTNLLSSSTATYCKIKAGTYVLTEDVDLGQRSLEVAAGDTVTICLNGHTLTSAGRVFSNYGTLNFCDCHGAGAEGNVISTQDGTAEDVNCYGPVMYAYYGSTANLYGGNLKATGLADSAGVVAVSHDGPAGTESTTSAVFNMYGGTISGGRAMSNAGLVAVWNGAVMNLYGGQLYDGTSGGKGGGIYVSDDSTLNIQGGQITQCSAVSGSGVFGTGVIHLSGAPQITGNDTHNVYIPYGYRLSSVDLLPEAQVGITAHTQMLIADCAFSAEGLVDDETEGRFQLHNGALFLAKETLPHVGTVSGFTAGYGRRDISPTEELKGLPLSGFGNDEARAWTEIADRLYATVIAVTDPDGQTVLLATFDLQAPRDVIREELLDNISVATGVPRENIYLSATHTHSAPALAWGTDAMLAYRSLVVEQFTLAALDAMADRQTATMYTGSFETSGLNFTRHYKYKDSSGVWQYFGDNFGTYTSSSSVQHVTENDPTMHMLKFDRAGMDILMVNWRAHPTMTGGVGKSVVSSDFIGPLRDTIEENTGMHFAYFQGAAGNQNTSSRISSENQTFNNKANYKQYGQEMARQIQNNLSVLKNIGTGTIETESYLYSAKVNHEEDARVEEARYVQQTYWDLSTDAERKALLETYNFTSVYHAGAVVTKYGMGENKDLCLGAFAIGDQVAFYTAPGELWNTIGVEIEKSSPYNTTFTLGYCNADAAYFTYGEALEYQSYESVYCRWIQPDTIYDMINYWKAALNRLYK